MSKSYWTTYTRDINSNNYTADSQIPRPNDTLDLSTMSMQVKIQLADGSYGYSTPETVSNKDPLAFKWLLETDSGGLDTLIQGYINNEDFLKIATHVVGRDFYGKFISVKSSWLTGISPDEYEIEAIFEQMTPGSSSSSSSSCRSSSSSSSSSSKSSSSSRSSSSSCRSSSSSSSG